MNPPSIWKTVKQPPGSRVCCAAVAAMAVGQSLDYAWAQMAQTNWEGDNQPYFKMRALLTFLGKRGIMVGMFFTVTEGKLDADETFRVDVSLRGMQAILAVPSPTQPGEWEHFVFWDGQNVRDPNPAVPETTALEDYKLLSIYPLTYIDESEGG
jgi:hypothetical protein